MFSRLRKRNVSVSSTFAAPLVLHSAPAMSREIDERALAALIEGRDDEAIAALDVKYRPRFEQIAARSGIPHADCADIAQEALAAALSQIRRGLFRGDSTLGTWLFTIVKGKIADYRRSNRRTALSARSEPAAGWLPDRPLESSHPAAQELRIVVRDALRAMPAEHRLILLLNQQGGLTIDDIAGRLGRSRGRVGALLAEAKRMFRESVRPGETSRRKKRLTE
jgi:RNA polymerase sigma factor (sigma-70 family)